ncbi:hypothetical protein CEUSTIGMA_g2199.t1 [Chlamydomonas eustigma]|uniref:Uncharacterized protein n=1 Tax=Chlamydomonas eustigma TaxID=1157962 RepID=A0A250WVV0_9CHLO|nr:hypothetical protein CEUSTIGMA_g2199.t1 [Chlamydomonas eustigma]|eukprot:GAX74752.1 hypothetical protein CEUSTIGMA_g2199.t1 [Chlamydomonas eustigma]
MTFLETYCWLVSTVQSNHEGSQDKRYTIASEEHLVPQRPQASSGSSSTSSAVLIKGCPRKAGSPGGSDTFKHAQALYEAKNPGVSNGSVEMPHCIDLMQALPPLALEKIKEAPPKRKAEDLPIPVAEGGKGSGKFKPSHQETSSGTPLLEVPSQLKTSLQLKHSIGESCGQGSALRPDAENMAPLGTLEALPSRDLREPPRPLAKASLHRSGISKHVYDPSSAKTTCHGRPGCTSSITTTTADLCFTSAAPAPAAPYA